MEQYITLNELFKSRRIYWIKSFQTLRKWIERDINTNNILEVKVIQAMSGSTGKRYYIPEENVDRFVNAFINRELYE